MWKNFKLWWKNLVMPKWAKIVLKIFAVLFLLLIAAYVCLAWYVNSNKQEVLASITKSINEDMTGSLVIGDMEPTFLTGFPGVSLRLSNVVIRDSLYAVHKRTLLFAGEIDVTVNALALVRGTVDIQKVHIKDAAIDLFTDASGYTNTSVFKKKKDTAPKEEEDKSFPELRKFVLENVSFKSENMMRNKLFSFKVYELKGSADYESPGFHADVDLKAFAESMAFSTIHGSFMKNRELDGNFDITYDKDEGALLFKPERLSIGGEEFIVGAKLGVGGNSVFTINIKNESILWLNAANLLSPNITEKLKMFDIKKPIWVTCDLVGDFNAEGDPLILVNAKIKDNTLDSPGGTIDNCNFKGVFTNNYINGKGYGDPNSAIKLLDFKGEYKGIPFAMNKAYILNLEKPVAVGDVRSEFEVSKLAGLIDEDLFKFSSGTASAKLEYKADIVDFRITKPYLKGEVNIKKANILYVPRKLNLKDVSVALDFTENDLNISEIALKSAKSTVYMKGSVKNFLNLYYTDPEKIVLNWEINSPQLNIGEFMGFLGGRQRGKAASKKDRRGNFTEELNTIFERSQVDMKLKVDKLFYNRFMATNTRAEVVLANSQVIVKNAGLNHAGGSLVINGSMSQTPAKNNPYKLNATIKNADIQKFFYAFHNFGMKSLTSENIRGYFSSTVKVSGLISDTGSPVRNSMSGNVNFTVKKGSLINFEPVISVGKFAFPFRDVKNITFTNLNGNLAVKNGKVTISPMQINSSLLNMDVVGVYAFGPGTNINISVPLRNPEKDRGITDEQELAERRNRGIVLHLIAADDEKGDVKIKLGKKKDDD